MPFQSLSRVSSLLFFHYQHEHIDLAHIEMTDSTSKLTAHQQQRRNKHVNERRKGKRETNRRKDFTTAPPSPGAHIVTRKMNPIDLFPEITQDFRQWYLEFQRQTAKHKKHPKRHPKPNQIFPCNPPIFKIIKRWKQLKKISTSSITTTT